jgi:carbon monoxide dehydrogenase subunit G
MAANARRTQRAWGIAMSDRLTIAARAHASADPQAVWALLEDVNRYKDWGPWSESGYVEQPVASPHGPGAVRRLRYRNRRAVTIEPVVEVQAGRRLVYDVTSGIPVRNYRATVELTPTANGTDVEWRATFDRTLRGHLIRGTLQRIYGEVVNRLVVAAEATSGASSR